MAKDIVQEAVEQAEAMKEAAYENAKNILVNAMSTNLKAAVSEAIGEKITEDGNPKGANLNVNYDPEGLLSTFPSVVSSLAGILVGKILMAALSYGFASIFGRRFAHQPPVVTAAGQLTASSIVLLPIVIYFEPLSSQTLPGISTSAAVLALALLCTALAYVLFFRILKLAGATNVSLVTFLIPVSAIALGVVVLDEKIEFIHIAGMAFIATGLAAIDGRAVIWLRKKL